MAISQEFKDAIESNNKMRVRIMLKDSLLIDPTLHDFYELEKIACKNIKDLYVEHDNETLNQNISTWDKDYLNKQMVVVVDNFSKERIELLKKMVTYLFKEKADKIKTERQQVQIKGNNINQQRNNISKSTVGTGVAIGGVAIAALGVATAHTIVTVGGIAAVAVGATLILTNKENR